MITYIKKRACFFRLFFVLQILHFSLAGQGINNIWVFGYANYSGAPWGTYNLSFYNNLFSIDTVPRLINELTTAANISDSSGNLLF
jgi:hypothetical protein